MFAGMTTIEQPEDKDMMVRRPCITDDGRALGHHLKGIGAGGINRPEVPVAHKRDFIATQVSRATRGQAQEEQEEQ